MDDQKLWDTSTEAITDFWNLLTEWMLKWEKEFHSISGVYSLSFYDEEKNPFTGTFNTIPFQRDPGKPASKEIIELGQTHCDIIMDFLKNGSKDKVKHYLSEFEEWRTNNLK